MQSNATQCSQYNPSECDFHVALRQQVCDSTDLSGIFQMFLLHPTFIELLFALSHSHQPQGGERGVQKFQIFRERTQKCSLQFKLKP